MSTGKISLRAIVESARLEMRRYGFRADGTSVEVDGTSIECVFEREAATGQAAFSQYAVTPYLRIFNKSSSLDLDAEIEIDGKLVIHLGVFYEHFGRGTNGYAISYTLTLDWDDEPLLARKL